MKIKDLFINRCQNSVLDAKSLIEESAIPEFAEIGERDLFEAIKPALQKHLNLQGFGLARLKYSCSFPNIIKLDDGNNYISVMIWVENFQDGCEDFIKMYIHPFGCCDIEGENTIGSKKEISKALKVFLSQELGQDYIDKNNEYYTMIKNKKTEKIKREAENKIDDVKDEYIDNIII